MPRIFEKIKQTLELFEIKEPVSQVTIKESKYYDGPGLKVALIDYGAKQNIIRSLQKRGCSVRVFPSYTNSEEILSYGFDGIMLSNGPGDPKDEVYAINTIRKLIKSKVPLFGICLGHQLLALASNADTKKLKYGHRGSNHPVLDVLRDKTYITSQNHGYAVLESTIDKSSMFVSHINMNDNTVEGLKYKDLPIFSVQFHPEACPGPQDSAYLFDEFIDMMYKRRNEIA